jgi:hypothetical protein
MARIGRRFRRQGAASKEYASGCQWPAGSSGRIHLRLDSHRIAGTMLLALTGQWLQLVSIEDRGGRMR